MVCEHLPADINPNNGFAQSPPVDVRDDVSEAESTVNNEAANLLADTKQEPCLGDETKILPSNYLFREV